MGRDRATIVELRQYRLFPGRRDELIDLFEHEFIETQQAAGMELVGLFCDAGDPNRFVWLRAFPGMEARRVALESFYDGPAWARHRDAANATMLDSGNVLLLRPALPAKLTADMRVRGPLLCVTRLCGSQRELETFVQEFERSTLAQLESGGAEILATLVTAPFENTFPRLPVREGEWAFVVLLGGIAEDALPQALQGSEIMELVPTARSPVRLSFVGSAGDFDFLTGTWTVTHRKLRERLCGSNDWECFEGLHRGYSLANGVLSVDEFEFPATRSKGCSIRNLDLAARRWSIYWTTSTSGRLFPPVHGGFAGERGEFFGNDLDNGTPVLARYVWSQCSTSTPRWEQAFSTDAGRSWETNWIMEFRRARSA